MTKVKAMKSFAKYLEENDIEYFDESDNEFGVPVYIIVCDAENTPDKFVEVNVVFYGEHDVEVHGIYGPEGIEICRLSKHRNRLYRLLNYINAEVILSYADKEEGVEPQTFYTSRIYLAEDGSNEIIFSTKINYDFWEVAPTVTCKYITTFYAELMDIVARPIFSVLQGNNTVEEAIKYLKESISKLG